MVFWAALSARTIWLPDSQVDGGVLGCVVGEDNVVPESELDCGLTTGLRDELERRRAVNIGPLCSWRYLTRPIGDVRGDVDVVLGDVEPVPHLDVERMGLVCGDRLVTTLDFLDVGRVRAGEPPSPTPTRAIWSSYCPAASSSSTVSSPVWFTPTTLSSSSSNRSH